MNNKTTGVLIFLAGAAVGGTAAWMTLKTKYERIAQEEIAAVREVYYAKKDALVKNAEIISEQGYAGEDDPAEEMEEEEEVMSKPYVISPEEFDTIDYDTVSLDYYANGVLVDEYDEVVENVGELIGDALEHFGEYEEDSVFVRDDEKMIDYEILRDHREYLEEN